MGWVLPQAVTGLAQRHCGPGMLAPWVQWLLRCFANCACVCGGEDLRSSRQIHVQEGGQNCSGSAALMLCKQLPKPKPPGPPAGTLAVTNVAEESKQVPQPLFLCRWLEKKLEDSNTAAQGAELYEKLLKAWPYIANMQVWRGREGGAEGQCAAGHAGACRGLGAGFLDHASWPVTLRAELKPRSRAPQRQHCSRALAPPPCNAGRARLVPAGPRRAARLL